MKIKKYFFYDRFIFKNSYLVKIVVVLLFFTIGSHKLSAQNSDTDGDGILNSVDLDDDNDGILDSAEGYCESISVYTMNGTASVANANASFGVNGNTFNLVYTLTSGPAVSGLGNSFNVPFTYSDFNNTATAVDHTWASADTSGTNVRLLPNTNSLYTNLPTNNTTTESTAGASADASDVGFRFLLGTGAINQLGTFTSSIGNLPSISGILSNLNTSDLTFTSVHNHVFQGSPLNRRFWFSGYYARPADLITEEPVVTGRTAIFPVSFGSTQNWIYTAFDSADPGNATNGGSRGLITILGNSVTYCNHRDTDSDGIPDYLDLDSDGDGCSDAGEGGADIANSELVTAGGSLSGGSTSVNQNLCASATCVSTTGINIGLPQFSSLPTGYSNTTGQSIGSSQNALVNGCVCYEDPSLAAGQTYPVKQGITILGRAGGSSTSWPMIRNSAYTALEAKTKGFVITRNASPETTIAIPIVGMMVFDTDENAGAGCMKIYTGSGAGEGWKCFSTQGCP
ncbi:hypothetical protein [Chryseobacterium gambrini]|uniref:hypothetical protein n=1 Tax=Chryseobacterium gambrini TaxID=373672 RepID=UPI003BA52A53